MEVGNAGSTQSSETDFTAHGASSTLKRFRQFKYGRPELMLARRGGQFGSFVLGNRVTASIYIAVFGSSPAAADMVP